MKTPYEFEIEEIELKPVNDLPNQWRDKLTAAVNNPGKQTSFDERVTIVEKIDVWSGRTN